MDNLRTPNKTPSNLLESFPKEIREAVSSTRRTNPQSSPFCLLPNNLTTPPSRFIKIRNPFEAAINEQLHKHIFSPSVFAEVKNPRNSDKFKWTIDDVSSLRPAQIDESTIAQFEQSTFEDDVHVQAKIEKYFSETHIVPSPFTQDTNQVPLLPETDSPAVKSSESPKETCNVWTQTVLSLPPRLPEAVENALLPYFSFTDDQRRQTVDLNSSLCRRLFHFESGAEESTVSSIHSEISCIGSPILGQDSDCRKRTYDSTPENSPNLIPSELSPIPSSTPRKLSNCPISPITLNMEHIQCRESTPRGNGNDSLSPPLGLRVGRTASRSFAKADFSGHMSVDNSFNLAPENEFIGGNTTNLSESPVRTNEFMESSCNWDLEYNCIMSKSNRSIRRSLFESRNMAEKMDISNLTTPKSKIINSQRKKLSDSFKFSESLSDDEILNFESEENQSKFRKFSRETSSKLDENFTLSQNTQDTGYQTELSQKSNYTQEEEENEEGNEDIIMLEEERESKENWNPNIYASTPSKRYFSNLEK